MPESRTGPGAWARFLQLLALATFALAQPLLDLIRRHPDFLVVHRTAWSDLAALVLLLVAVPPAALWAATTLVGRIDRRAGVLAHEAALALLLAATLVPVLDAQPALDGYLTLVAAAAAAAAGWWIHRRFAAVRDNLALLALTVPVFVGLFVLSGAVRSAVAPQAAPAAPEATATRPVPVVLVVLDELPLATLLDGRGGIDAALFPGFRRLADRATWYPRAAAVSGATLRAVPAVLAGRFTDWDQPSTLAGHPDNVFTALGPTHRIVAAESQTSLCPAAYRDRPPGFGARLAGLLRDVRVLYGHVVLPASLRGDLPPIDNKWSGFAGDAGAQHGVTRHQRFREFVGRIERTGEPLLAVTHALLPHSPYRHYPDGRIYFWREGLEHAAGGVMSPDTLAVRDTYRRHLLQTVSVDRLLGELLDRLEAEDLLDEVLLVVTADHGACFTPGLPHRGITDASEHDLMSVPLFIKYPGQRTARRDERFVQSVDIYPTILEAVGAPLPDDLDGFPLADASRPERRSLGFLVQDRRQHLTVAPERLADRARTCQWKDTHFQGLAAPGEIYEVGGLPGWTGRSVADLPLGEPVALDLTLDAPERFGDVRPDSVFVPGEITGEIEARPGHRRERLAVAVGGRLAGSGETYLDLDGDGRRAWSVLVPPEALRPGANTVEVFLVDERDGAPVFHPLSAAPRSLLDVALGARAEGDVRERGFHKTERWRDRPFRWTDGRALLELPLREGERADSLLVDLVSTGPGGTDLEILVDGRPVFAGAVPRGPWSGEFPLPAPGTAPLVRVEIVSGTFSPDASGEDTRMLGVGVARITLRGAAR